MSLPVTVTQDARPMRPCQKFEGHTKWVTGIIHLPDGQRMVTCSNDGSLRVWNFQTGKQIANWRDGEGLVCAIALSPDGNKVVSGSEDGVLRLWNIDTGRVIAKWMGHGSNVISVYWHRDAERVVSGSHDGTARVWDVENGKTVLKVTTPGNIIWAVTYSPDTTMIATGGKKNFIQIWDVKTGKLVTNLKGHTGEVECLAWTAKGTTLISGSLDSSIRTWNTSTWRQIAVLTGHTSSVFCIAISPNGRILASASLDKTARLWNLENGQQIGEPIQHAEEVTRVSFSTDGKLLATSCENGDVYSWDISVVIGGAGLDALLNPNNDDKSLLDADATQPQGRRRENAHQLHPGFFDDSPHPSIRPPISPSFARHEIPSRLGFLEWARTSSFNWPRKRNDEGIELQECRPAVVDVPLAQGRPRNYTARELRMKKEKEKARNAKNAGNAKNASASSSRSPLSNFTQQSTGAAQALPSSELHGTVFTSSIASAVAAIPTTTRSATSLPGAIIPRTGRWTRFNCCTSAQGTNGQH